MTGAEQDSKAKERQGRRPRQRAFPRALLGLTIFITLSASFTLVAYSVALSRRVESVWDTTQRLAIVQGAISRLDEVLTSSARLAVLTGDPVWTELYRQNEPMLAAAIEEAEHIFPYSSIQLYTADVSQANDALIAYEHEALDFLRNGDPEEAEEILFGGEYQAQKELYAIGVRESFQALEDIAANEQQTVKTAVTKFIMIFIALLVALILLWTWLWRSINFYIESKLVLENRLKNLLKEQREDLHETHGELRREVSNSASLQAQLLQAQKMEALGSLAGSVAHDFNNLLAGILGFTRIVQDTFAPDDARRNDLQRVVEATDSAAELTGQLLSFARRRPIDLSVIDLRETLLSCDTILRRTLNKRITLVMSHPPEPLMIWANKAQIEQVILNLAINSADAMPDGGMLTIDASQCDVEGQVHLKSGTYVSLTVTDTGDGIPEELVSKIFDPFFTTKGDLGTGLGLTTSFGTIRQCGGDIAVNTSPGNGTTFTVLIPLTDHQVSSLPGVPLIEEAPCYRSATILVVEDTPNILHLVARGLREMGHTVYEATSAEEALAMDVMVELLVTDVMLPGISGVDLAGRMRDKAPHFPVLFISGYVGEDGVPIETQAETLFLEKPFSPEQLAAAIEQLLGTLKAPRNADLARETQTSLSA